MDSLQLLKFLQHRYRYLLEPFYVKRKGIGVWQTDPAKRSDPTKVLSTPSNNLACSFALKHL